MKPTRYLTALIVLAFVAASPFVHAFQSTPNQEKPVAEKKPQEPVKDLRSRFDDVQADEPTLAIIAGDLIKAGDQSWLRSKLLDPECSLARKSVILSAFWAKKDISAMEEILLLSVSGENDEARRRCREILQNFLLDKDTRAATIKKLLEANRKEGASEPLLVGTLRALGESGDLSAIDPLVTYVGHNSPALSDEAVQALRKITYQDFGADQAAWKGWWDKNRHLPSGILIASVLKGRLDAAQVEVNRLKEQNTNLAFDLIRNNPDKAVDYLEWEEVNVRREAAKVIKSHLAQNPAPAILERVAAHLEKGEKDEETLKPLLELIGRSSGNRNNEQLPPALLQKFQGIMLTYLRDDQREAIKVEAAKGLEGFKNSEVHTRVIEILGGLKARKDGNALKVVLLERLDEFGHQDDIDLISEFLAPSNEKRVREEAVKALGATASLQAIEILKKTLIEEPDRNIRYVVTQSLTKLGRAGTPENGMKQIAVEALKQSLRDHETNVRQGAITGIGVLNPPDAIQIIREHILWEKIPDNLGWCVDALRVIRDPEGLDLILDVLTRVGKENGAVMEGILKMVKPAILDICGDDLNQWLQAAEALFTKGQYDLVSWCCGEYLNRAKGKNGSDGPMKRMQALQAESKFEIFWKANDFKNALPHARNLAEKIDPASNDYALKLARVLSRSPETLEEAAAVYKTLIERFPPDPAAALWSIKVEAAECLLEKEDAGGALAYLQGYPGPATQDLSEELLKRMAEVKRRADALLGQGKPPEGKPDAVEKKPPEGGGADQAGENKDRTSGEGTREETNSKGGPPAGSGSLDA